MNDTRPEVYSTENAKLAWGRMVAFFHKHLDGGAHRGTSPGCTRGPPGIAGTHVSSNTPPKEF